MHETTGRLLARPSCCSSDQYPTEVSCCFRKPIPLCEHRSRFGNRPRPPTGLGAQDLVSRLSAIAALERFCEAYPERSRPSRGSGVAIALLSRTTSQVVSRRPPAGNCPVMRQLTLHEQYRRAEQSLHALLLGDSMRSRGRLKGEGPRQQASRDLREMRSALRRRSRRRARSMKIYNRRGSIWATAGRPRADHVIASPAQSSIAGK